MKSLLIIVAIFFAASSFAEDVGVIRIIGATNEATPSPASLVGIYIVDAQGRRTGSDPTRSPVIDPKYLFHKCCHLNEIPGLNTRHDRLDPDDDSGAFGNESFEITGQLPAGTYNLVVFSTVTFAVPYLTDIRLHDVTGKMNESTAFSFLPAGTTASFTINYDPAAGKVPVVTKSLDFSILRQELQATFQLEDIGGQRFVDQLDGILAQGQNTLERKDHDQDKRPDVDDRARKLEAIARLREFSVLLDLVERESNLRPQQPQDHDHDRDDEKRRFVAKAAADSLISDAKTLTQQLGGKADKNHGHDRDAHNRDHDSDQKGSH